MDDFVYIVICYIPAYDHPTTLTEVFDTLKEAQIYKRRRELANDIIFCDIYKAQKIESHYE